MTLAEVVADVAAELHCDCYWPDLMEFGPNHPCPKCRLVDALKETE